MTPPTVQFIPAAGGGDYTDFFDAGSDYWIVPDDTANQTSLSPSGGDGSTNWSTLQNNPQPGITFPNVQVSTNSTASVTMDDRYNFCIRNANYGQDNNPYKFCAIWYDGTYVPSPENAEPDNPGWVVYGNAGGTNRQYFVPIEVQSDVVITDGGTQTGAGYGPEWNDLGFDDSLIFFFDSYTPGDVQGWTPWDGTTTP